MDPRSGRPAYQQIADELRHRIRGGALAPGSKLPTEVELMSEFGVSRVVARLAVGELRTEGLIYSRQGKGTFVRERGPVRRIAGDRYRHELAQITRQGAPEPPIGTSFTHDHGITWDQYRLDKDFHVIPAPYEVAEALDLDLATLVLQRRFVFYANGRPQQMSWSYYPFELVRDTPVADPANEPWPGGNLAQLATLGIFVTTVEESVRSRMPTPDERRILAIAEGVPVLTVTRRMLIGPENGRRPVETASIVIPADNTALDYTINLE
ncbi:MAG: GntR family transcriptional regulator [Pseudonocardiaceae bacterium]